jgi:radial spoke head protein 9
MGIDSNKLLLDVEQLAFSGIVLSVEQRAALQTSLSIAKEQYKFNRIYFWGKIIGTKEDYYVACGVGNSEINQRTFLYRFVFLNNRVSISIFNPITAYLIQSVLLF